ncbi:hypothetical protein FACS1894182_06460 [Bacteroidia bacterium]|nr:hypothetical protein FACS1894182_06460 [Bacteroidia bacterium]
MSGRVGGSPVIGNNVVIGAGSSILGNVTIADYVFVGAGSVVVNDIPGNVSIGGIPAKILKPIKKEKIASFYYSYK